MLKDGLAFAILVIPISLRYQMFRSQNLIVSKPYFEHGRIWDKRKIISKVDVSILIIDN